MQGERINIFNHLEKAQEFSRTEKVVKDAKKKWSKIKGEYIVVPNFLPRTEIFVRNGQDKFEKIDEFKAKRRAVAIR